MGKHKVKKSREPTSSTSSIESSPASKVSKMADHAGSLNTSEFTKIQEFMQIQQDCFKSLVNSLMDSFNKRLDDLSKEVQTIKVSLEYTQKEVNEAQDQLKNVSSLDADIASIRKSIEENQDKLDYLENQSRRSNVRINRIKEDKDESWDDTETKVKEVLTKMDIPPEDVKIERAHRTGKPNPSRQIVVKFLRYKVCSNLVIN